MYEKFNQPTNEIPGMGALKDYFTQIGPAFYSKLPVYFSTIARLTETMVLNNITIEEITEIIRNLKSEKSTGYDWISNEIREYCSTITESYVFKECLDQSIFPEPLKRARVTPFSEKGERSNPENYRFNQFVEFT